MSQLRVIAISTELAERVRRMRSSPGYGHAVHSEVATGYGPCRHCLRNFAVGVDRRLLFTLDPFHGLAAIPAPGPVFVHEASCERHGEDAGYPAELLAHSCVLEGYDAGQRIVAREVVTDGSQESLTTTMLEDASVKYVMVRDLSAGCFDFRVERSHLAGPA